MNEELQNKIEKGHTFKLEENDTIVWQLGDRPPQEEAENLKDMASDHIPEAKHLVISDLEELYLVKDAEVEK